MTTETLPRRPKNFGDNFEEVTLPGVDEGEILVIRSTVAKRASRPIAKVGASSSLFLPA